jgi:hypothetical protein
MIIQEVMVLEQAIQLLSNQKEKSKNYFQPIRRNFLA